MFLRFSLSWRLWLFSDLASALPLAPFGTCSGGGCSVGSWHGEYSISWYKWAELAQCTGTQSWLAQPLPLPKAGRRLFRSASSSLLPNLSDVRDSRYTTQFISCARACLLVRGVVRAQSTLFFSPRPWASSTPSPHHPLCHTLECRIGWHKELPDREQGLWMVNRKRPSARNWDREGIWVPPL